MSENKTSKPLMDLRTGEKFQMDDFPNMTLVAWVVTTSNGLTRLVFKIDREGARFDEFVKPALSTVYSV